MRVGVVGAGAIGGFIAAALARAGVAVAIVARGPHLAAVRAGGLCVDSDLGSFCANVEAAGDLRELGAFDVLLLTFKSHDWPALLPQLAPFAGSSTTVVTMQNGLPFWYVRRPPLESVDPGGRIGALFADEQVLGGVVHVSGHIAQPGRIRQSGGMRYVLGEPAGGMSARVERLVELLAGAGLSPQADPDIRATVWLKLVNNVGLNPVSALRRLTIKPMLADPIARAEVHDLMTEALHVGQALGVVHDVDIDARIDYAARLDDVKTSMLQDYERGRTLEIEPILGSVIELADRYGVAVERIRTVRAALHAAQAERVADG
ncbi:MAG TPA: 2-dehydropantoate 2-reductase [Candidatus Baltobacteraceae bacterium]|nr:2-dehydropantoate 2-reductase [Candidatus Baltobacteraceae bacterium]